MGLIKAIAGAAGGVMADQWKEFFTCEALPANVLAVKGQKKTTRRSSNTHGDENIITTGSRIAVADGQCMLIVEQGKVVDIFMSPQHETTKALIGNVMARDMPASILDRFRKARENHPNSDAVYLLRLAFSGNEVTRPVISECSRRFNLDFNILRGTVDDVQGQTLGSLTVLIEAESSVFIEAVNFLRENGVVVEEINDVK